MLGSAASADDVDVPVVISYEDLLASDLTPLHASVKNAFVSSSTSLGILLISNLPPRYADLRNELLTLANTFASLEESVKDKYVDAATSYSFGYSHGKEMMVSTDGTRRPDMLKASFYNNVPCDDARNRWPDSEQGMQRYRALFEELTSLCFEVGLLVARVCDGALQADGALENSRKGTEQLIRESTSSKARLLHYFPSCNEPIPIASSQVVNTSSEAEITDSWCGTHIDHSILTALVPAIYLFHPAPTASTSKLRPLIIPSPDPAAGLYIRTRAGRTVKAAIPIDCLAFQTGETLELLSGYQLAATPHFVNGSSSSLSAAARAVIAEKIRTDESWREVVDGSITREALAVFLQPNDDEVVSRDQGHDETFAQFTQRVLSRHY